MYKSLVKNLYDWLNILLMKVEIGSHVSYSIQKQIYIRPVLQLHSFLEDVKPQGRGGTTNHHLTCWGRRESGKE